MDVDGMDAIGVLALLLVAAACFVVGATVVVSVAYYRRWQALGRRRLLPLHVWTVAISYDLLLIAQIITTSIDPRWWRIALITPALALGSVAMVALTRYERPQKPPGSTRH